MIRVLIIGGYGNFGSFIAGKLAQEDDIQLIIAGRDEAKARGFAARLQAKNNAESHRLDINKGFKEALAVIKPHVVIHTSGPYQGQGYDVAEACINQGCHYMDLADGRNFVSGITQLDEKAKEKGVLICSGASSVPCLSSAIIEKYKGMFSKLEKIEYAIATAQLTNRGFATTSAAFSYAGKPFKTLVNGKMQDVYGWTDLRSRNFWGLGSRLIGACDIPDLEIFPGRYPDLKTIRFGAGLELKTLHIILFVLSWLVRLRIIPSLVPAAGFMLKTSFLFDPMGSDNSGFYMSMFGVDGNGKQKQVDFEIIARHGDGLYIPSMPSIIMAKKFAKGQIMERGAKPCLDIITLDEYMEALKGLDVEWRVNYL